ncbi:MAG: DUF262 domain-containing protein [Ferruginibacter sp.]
MSDIKGKIKRMDFITQPFKINDVLGWYERKELTLSPKFQRRAVWKPKGKSNLIDSIIKGFPLPPFFIREQVSVLERRTSREVIDGQQRIRTIMGFIAGEFTMQKIHNEDYAKVIFQDLPEDIQLKFLSYVLTINVVGQITNREVYEMFSRLNSYSVPLNQAEKANALYTGVFKQNIDNLAQSYLSFWEQSRIFSETSISRMQEIQITAELVALMMKGITDGKHAIYNKVKGLYKIYDDTPPAKLETYIKRFDDVINHVNKLLGEDLKNMEFRRPPIFYSLFGAIYDTLYGLPPNEHDEGEKDFRPVLHLEAADMVKQELLELNDAVLNWGKPSSEENDDDDEEEDSPPEVGHNTDIPEEYAEFIKASTSSTDKLPQRKIRHKVIKDILSVCFS